MLNNTQIARLLLLAALAVLIALGAGCGGGNTDGDSGPTPPEETIAVNTSPITKAQYITRANALCHEAWSFVVENFKEFSQTQDRSLSTRDRFAEAMQMTTVSAIGFHILDSLRYLGAPANQRPQIEEIVGAMHSAITFGREQKSIDSIANLSETFADFNDRAEQYGLDSCMVNAAHLRGIRA
jgi:hypothetical protein